MQIDSGIAYAISGDGSTSVGISEKTVATPIRQVTEWLANGQEIRLGFQGTGYGVSFDGSVVVGVMLTNTGTEAFRWKAGQATGLGLLPLANDGRAQAVSGDGSIVVGFDSFVRSSNRAFIWDESDGSRDLAQVLSQQYGLDLTGWTLQEAPGFQRTGR